MTTEKRPQDWTVEKKLKMVITCGDMDEESVNQLCPLLGFGFCGE